MKHLEEKVLLSFAIKLIEKKTDYSNMKEQHQSYLQKRNKKLVKGPKLISQQPKAIENPTLLT